MSQRPHLGHAALAIATMLVIAACSSDTPTGPLTASQSLAAAPTIALSRTRLSLCYPATYFPASVRGWWCYPSGSLYISNTGGGTLNWTSSRSATWIKRSPTYATGPSAMKVWVDGTGLPRGNYSGWIKVWAKGATNSPQTVSVVMYRH